MMVEVAAPAPPRNGVNGQIALAQALTAQAMARVEHNLRDFPDLKPDGLRQAIETIVASGGKRIRPMVALLAAGLLGGESDERTINVASAVEMLHTATLVHDDLIDGSLMRRGAATLNASWTPAATVLTGDFLFAYAAGLAARADSVHVMQIFADTLGVIVSGELRQSFTDWSERATRDDYYRRIYAKTASMFVLAAVAAGLLSAADESHLETLRSYGHNLGMAFQIVDDILDFTADQTSIGKPVGGDLRRGLITLPMILYAEQHADDGLVDPALRGVCAPDEYDALIDRIRQSDAIAGAFGEAAGFGDAAHAALLRFEPGPYRDALAGLVDYTLARRV